MEVDSLEKRYTVDTLERMRVESPGSEFLFILGTDMYRDFETWRSYRALFTLAHIVVVNRPGFPFREGLAPHRVLREGEEVTPGTKPEVFYLPFVEQRVSSTAIRDACRRGEDASEWVPPAVWSYIRKHKLYS
jgi:nicotinate-nucleotide adenylyltransferase